VASMTVTIVCRQRWWLKYYLACVLTLMQLTGREPNPERIAFWVGRGLKVEVR